MKASMGAKYTSSVQKTTTVQYSTAVYHENKATMFASDVWMRGLCQLFLFAFSDYNAIRFT